MAQEVGPRGQGTTGYRIRRGNVVAVTAMPWQTSLIPFGRVRVVYDDGGEDDLYFDPSVTTTAGTEFTAITKIAARDGWIVDGAFGLRATGFPARAVTAYGVMLILSDVNASDTLACIGQGCVGLRDFLSVGNYRENTYEPVFVFQGTVIEDATAGTHVSSLDVTPGTGNSIQVMGGMFKAGAGAANLVRVFVDDGTNELIDIIGTAGSTLSLASGQGIVFPVAQSSGLPNASGVYGAGGWGNGLVLSGTMRFHMQVSTATVSLTHTFAFVCRLKNGIPSTVLADSVGVPTLTTNTSAVF